VDGGGDPASPEPARMARGQGPCRRRAGVTPTCPSTRSRRGPARCRAGRRPA
jgi:hypothetical protein